MLHIFPSFGDASCFDSSVPRTAEGMLFGHHSLHPPGWMVTHPTYNDVVTYTYTSYMTQHSFFTFKSPHADELHTYSEMDLSEDPVTGYPVDLAMTAYSVKEGTSLCLEKLVGSYLCNIVCCLYVLTIDKTGCENNYCSTSSAGLRQ